MLITTPQRGNGSPALRTLRITMIDAGMSATRIGREAQDVRRESFHLHEQRDDLGGTLHANTYPGLHCDVASRY